MFRSIEDSCQMGFRHRHPNCIAEALAKGPSGDLNTWSQTVLRMSWGNAAPLTEVLQVLHRQVVSRKVQERVKKCRAMAPREDEAIAIRPFRTLGVMPKMSCP